MPTFAMSVDALGSLRWPKLCAVCGEVSTAHAVASAATKDFGVRNRYIGFGSGNVAQWRIYVHYPVCQRHRLRCRLLQHRPDSRFRLGDAIVNIPFYALIALVVLVFASMGLSALFAKAGLHALASVFEYSHYSRTFVGVSTFTAAAAVWLAKIFWIPVQVRELRYRFMRFTLTNKKFFDATIAINHYVSL
jgi:hypothetical protein